MRVDEGGEDQLARAIDRAGNPTPGTRPNLGDPVALHNDVGGGTVGEAGILQSPHGGLTLAPGPGGPGVLEG